MTRLFVAVDLPEIIKDQLTKLKAEIPAARWVGRDQMHITLFFIGETGRLEVVKSALGAVRAPPFDLALAGVGRFPPGERKPPRVLWVGITEQPALIRLQAEVSQALVKAGCTPEERSFSPHITLARLKTERASPETTHFITAHQSFQAGPFSIATFALYSSQLTPQGARYQKEAFYPLAE